MIIEVGKTHRGPRLGRAEGLGVGHKVCDEQQVFVLEWSFFRLGEMDQLGISKKDGVQQVVCSVLSKDTSNLAPNMFVQRQCLDGVEQKAWVPEGKKREREKNKKIN